jgi:subtilisin family serine protease
MAGYTFKGKQKLCYTEVSDFTDFQGVGHDPLYKRFDSVQSVVRKVVAPEYQHFLATPQYIEEEDQICWHISAWNETPQKFVELTGDERAKYESIKENTIKVYRSATQNCDGEDLMIMAGAIRYLHDDCIYCCDNKVFLVAWGMTPDTHQHKVIGSVIHDFDLVKKYKITFDASSNGVLVSKLDKSMTRPEGFVLSARDLPEISANEGWAFDGWSPSPVGVTVSSDLNFVASYRKIEKPVIPEPPVIPADEPEVPEEPEEPVEKKPKYYTCDFIAGEHGKTEGISSFSKQENTTLTSSDIPQVKPSDGYEFKRWVPSPDNVLMDSNKTFTAEYTRIPWRRRFWLWLTSLFAGKGCLKWLLWLLLTLLAIGLLMFLLRSCNGCTGHHEENGVVPIDTVTTSDGRVIDDNGRIKPITGDDGKLPDQDDIVAPATGEDGEEIPIIRQPGVPNTIANRLFLFMENENDNIEALAQDFKKAYTDDRYSIIGYDKEVKLLVVQIPENERDNIRQTINSKIPNHKFIVFDEEIYELNGHVSTSTENVGWHLDAVHLKQGWSITKGSADVKVAVVDDGIEASHPMFKGRIVDAYNVFTQNNKLSLGQGHGTHTAGLAAGSADYYAKGAAGVAPNCKLMPIQVFDNNQCPLSALIAGTMYAIHHGADVVNLSIGPSFKGLNQLPVEQQNEIAKRQFKNVEKLWARVCALAAKKNCILVFAAGNDDILSSIPPENRNASAIVVAAVDKNLYPTDFTNYGPCSDISAPGKGIYSSYPRGDFKSFDGTSMAAPIVSGTIALMKSIKKDLTVTQARNVLYKTGSDVYGFMPPMVLVDKALLGIKRGDFSTPKVREMPPVPDGAGDESAANRQQPIADTTPVANVDSPASQGNETDYDAIRRQIAEYKKKINELEKLLPKK